MYEFLDRLVNVALPRVRDFKGVPPKGFDGRGNYALGLTEQIIFPEIVYDKVDKVRGHGHHDRDHRAERTRRRRRSSHRWACRSGSDRHDGQDLAHHQAAGNPEIQVARLHAAASSAAGPRGYLRKFQMCRLCFRELALKGEVPGVIKASW